MTDRAFIGYKVFLYLFYFLHLKSADSYTGVYSQTDGFSSRENSYTIERKQVWVLSIREHIIINDEKLCFSTMKIKNLPLKLNASPCDFP